MKNDYIYERRGKRGTSLQIKVPQKTGDGRSFSTETIRVEDYESRAAAYAHARIIRDEMLIEARNNRPIKRAPTVGELYAAYWELSPYSINTRQHYSGVYTALIEPLKDKSIADITAADIQALLVEYAEGHSVRRVSDAKTMWHRLYVTAQMQGVNISDKTLLLLPVHCRGVANSRKTGPITYEDLVTFTHALLNHSDHQMQKTEKIDRDVWYLLWVMYYTGCRPAEVLALCREDIDLENNQIQIKKSIGSTRKDMRQFVDTKRPKSRRTLPISPQLKIVLADLLSHSNSTPLLADSDGLPYSIKKITDRIRVTKTITGISLNAYKLRHMFSDDLFESGVSPVVIRDLMGHTSATMSLEYASATEDQKADALNTREQNGNRTLS